MAATSGPSYQIRERQETKKTIYDKVYDAVFDPDWRTKIPQVLKTPADAAALNTLSQNKFSCTIIQSAIVNEYYTVVSFLIEHYGKFIDFLIPDSDDNTSLTSAVRMMNTGLVETILEQAKHNYSPEEFKKMLNKPDNKGRTPLHFACALGQLKIVKMLIAAGADLNARDKDGKTPFEYTKLTYEEVYKIIWSISILPFRNVAAKSDSLCLNECGEHLFKLVPSKKLLRLSPEARDKVEVRGSNDAAILFNEGYYKLCTKMKDFVVHEERGATSFDFFYTFGNVDTLLKQNIKGMQASDINYTSLETEIIFLQKATGFNRIPEDLVLFKDFFSFLELNKNFVRAPTETDQKTLNRPQEWLDCINKIIPIAQQYLATARSISSTHECSYDIGNYTIPMIDDYLSKCTDFAVLLKSYLEMNQLDLSLIDSCMDGKIAVREYLLTLAKAQEEKQTASSASTHATPEPEKKASATTTPSHASQSTFFAPATPKNSAIDKAHTATTTAVSETQYTSDKHFLGRRKRADEATASVLKVAAVGTEKPVSSIRSGQTSEEETDDDQTKVDKAAAIPTPACSAKGSTR